jgi:hypothetical protein|tara:strand:+ start:333 stop:539 length:207 start_codon:yes stop_codon:yes gene_type:complete
MKKLLNIAKGFFLQPETVKNAVDGIEKIGKVRVNKKRVALAVTIVLAILVLAGAISEETFIELFKDIN